jgi:PAS domain S-box-containing protein
MFKRDKIFEELDRIAPLIPIPIYWLDINYIILGGNDLCLEAIGSSGTSIKEVLVGKTYHDYYPKEIADELTDIVGMVLKNNTPIKIEEKIVDVATGKFRYYETVRAPLFGNNGNVVGTICTAIEITDKKEAENLRVESEKHKAFEKQQEKFTQLANQVAHDIRSPLGSLLVIIKECVQLPEGSRIALREAAIGIGDIANHLLHQYQKKDNAEISEYEERHPILVSTVLLETLSAKKYQYDKLAVKFDYHFEANTHFAFIKTQSSAFKRMLSNIINNAVDALDGQVGKVDLQLETDNEWVRIIIQDTGKGMSAELIDKIMHKTAVTEGKKSGHGLGLTQVWETLDHNQGELHIASEPGKGTNITLIFPRATAPHWIAEEITLRPNDIVVILDDDTSIHGAWRVRFDSILSQDASIQLKHFQQGREALEFIQALAPTEKESVFLLSDYELLTQELNGLHIISQSKIKRSMLVTSHYADPLIQAQAAKIDTKILPKQLASEILIKITAADEQGTENVEAEKIDAVIVDDDRTFVNMLVLHIFATHNTEEYRDPENFLNNVDKYPKDTKIFLDNHYATSDLKGLDVAKELHARGYQHLYLLSGEAFGAGDVPSYLTVIGKTDIERLKKIVASQL